MNDLPGLAAICLIFGFLPWMAFRARADRRRQDQAVQTLSQEEQRALDRIGDLRGVLRERFGEKVRTPLIADRGFFSRRLPGVSRAGLGLLDGVPDLAEDVVATLEARALWARYGL